MVPVPLHCFGKCLLGRTINGKKTLYITDPHDDVTKWKHFPRYWPFVRGIHRSRWIPRTKANDAELWRFLWSTVWINSWVNNREAGDLRRYRAHYDVIVMSIRLFDVTIALSSHHIGGLVQERRNSSALAMELRLSGTNPSICSLEFHYLHELIPHFNAGVLNLVWVVFWVIFVSESPRIDPTISLEERVYIEQNTDNRDTKKVGGLLSLDTEKLTWCQLCRHRWHC